MFAVIKTGGKQYKVSEGDTLVIEKLSAAAGDTVTFDQVLMIGEGAGTGCVAVVDAADAARRIFRRRADAEAPLVLAAVDARIDGPAAGAADARQFLKLGAAHAAARADQRDRFEDVGLAGAVGTDDRRRTAIERDVGARIGAEVGDGETADARAFRRVQGRSAFQRVRHSTAESVSSGVDNVEPTTNSVNWSG